jgi:3-hydroxyacyl-CoA dehydrogenase
VIAAIHGTALGGGLEVALVATTASPCPRPSAACPKSNLGLLPGAGGTQRLPRVRRCRGALEMITSGRHVPAAQAHARWACWTSWSQGPDLRAEAVAFARRVVAEGRPLRKVRELDAKDGSRARRAGAVRRIPRRPTRGKFRGFLAPEYNIRCIEAAVNLPFDEGLKEKRLFMRTDGRLAVGGAAPRLLRRAPGGRFPVFPPTRRPDPGQASA